MERRDAPNEEAIRSRVVDESLLGLVPRHIERTVESKFQIRVSCRSTIDGIIAIRIRELDDTTDRRSGRIETSSPSGSILSTISMFGDFFLDLVGDVVDLAGDDGDEMIEEEGISSGDRSVGRGVSSGGRFVDILGGGDELDSSVDEIDVEGSSCT